MLRIGAAILRRLPRSPACYVACGDVSIEIGSNAEGAKLSITCFATERLRMADRLPVTSTAEGRQGDVLTWSYATVRGSSLQAVLEIVYFFPCLMPKLTGGRRSNHVEYGGKEGSEVKMGLLLGCLMLCIAGCSTTDTTNMTLAGKFALSASTGAFR